jgi:hypothetical protein
VFRIAVGKNRAIAWHNIYVKPKNKAEKEREGADRIAEIMYAALTKLPKPEQKDAVKAVQAIKINGNRNTESAWS